jgi:hypothetical protein
MNLFMKENIFINLNPSKINILKNFVFKQLLKNIKILFSHYQNF